MEASTRPCRTILGAISPLEWGPRANTPAAVGTPEVSAIETAPLATPEVASGTQEAVVVSAVVRDCNHSSQAVLADKEARVLILKQKLREAKDRAVSKATADTAKPGAKNLWHYGNQTWSRLEPVTPDPKAATTSTNLDEEPLGHKQKQ